MYVCVSCAKTKKMGFSRDAMHSTNNITEIRIQTCKQIQHLINVCYSLFSLFCRYYTRFISACIIFWFSFLLLPLFHSILFDNILFSLLFVYVPFYVINVICSISSYHQSSWEREGEEKAERNYFAAANCVWV